MNSHQPFHTCLAMAGNIIPAIATTNAIIAGMMVMLAFKILNKRLDDCKTVSDFCNKYPYWGCFGTSTDYYDGLLVF